MEQNRNNPDIQSNSLQPLHELIGGGDPDRICTKYGIARQDLDKMISDYKASWRRTALADSFTLARTGRNDSCPCGSGKKYKKCCLPLHEEARKNIPPEKLRVMEERVRAREQLEKDILKGFDLIFSQEFGRAGQLANSLLASYPEDDRLHDIALAAGMASGDYDAALSIAGQRVEIAREEMKFFQENEYYKREGEDKSTHVHFYSPITWLERSWVANRARTWQKAYPADPGSELFQTAGKLRSANDLKRFPEKEEQGYDVRCRKLAPVLSAIESHGPAALPYLLPLTYNFTWASLFVPTLLNTWGTDECLRLLAELSMFRYPMFAQKCLTFLEQCDKSIPVIEATLAENKEFDELKVGLLAVLGYLPGPKSFEILVPYSESESRYITAFACEALSRHENPAAEPYLDKARKRLGDSEKIASAIKEIKGMTE